MFLGSGLDIMITALNKAQAEGVTLPPFIQPMDITVLKNLVRIWPMIIIDTKPYRRVICLMVDGFASLDTRWKAAKCTSL